MFAVHSSKYYFSKSFRKVKQFAIRYYCPVTILSAKKPIRGDNTNTGIV